MLMLGTPPVHGIAVRPDGLGLVKVVDEEVHLAGDAEDPRVHVDAEPVRVPDAPHLVGEHEHDGAGDGDAEHGQQGRERGDVVGGDVGAGAVDEHLAVFDREDDDHDPAREVDGPEEDDGDDVCE